MRFKYKDYPNVLTLHCRFKDSFKLNGSRRFKCKEHFRRNKTRYTLKAYFATAEEVKNAYELAQQQFKELL